MTADLRNLAEKATPGPWKNDGADVFEEGGEIAICVDGPSGLLAELPTGVFALTENGYTPELHAARWAEAYTKQANRDAAYIAALSPDVVLALLDERDRLHRIAETARRVAGFELGVILPTDDGLAAYIDAKNDLLDALQESPDDR